ncbi:MAG: outer membrane beta-barrel protein [Ignavibacteriae bacterium]|nr:outer membrane beta-barrel protein [Ignavibacteriota bacterium]
MKTYLVRTLASAVFFLVLPAQLTAQNVLGRWAFSLHADGNIWLNDYNQRKIGFGADVQFRYGLTRSLSLGAEFGFSKLKSKQDPLRPEFPTDYVRLNAIPLSLLGWYHFMPGNGISPYCFAGIGLMHYTRTSGIGTYLPDTRGRTSIRIPAGVGFENFVHRRVSFDLNIAYTFFDDRTDMIRRGGADAAVDVKFGLNFYLGSSDDDDDDRDGLKNVEEESLGTNPTNPDSDEDGLNDGQEVRRLHTDPLKADTDGDRLKDGEEIFKYYTDPRKADTDGDGVSDGEEVLAGADPLVPNAPPPK